MLRANTTYVTTTQLAAQWKKSAYTVCEYAKQGRIDGAVKDGNEWRFPESAVLKPATPISRAARVSASGPLDAARARLDQMKAEARHRGRHA
jgi:predicted site-specific integrase-resolvase